MPSYTAITCTVQQCFKHVVFEAHVLGVAQTNWLSIVQIPCFTRNSVWFLWTHKAEFEQERYTAAACSAVSSGGPVVVMVITRICHYLNENGKITARAAAALI